MKKIPDKAWFVTDLQAHRLAMNTPREINLSHCFLDCRRIDHFKVVCLVAYLLNENEAGVDLVFDRNLTAFPIKFVLISMWQHH